MDCSCSCSCRAIASVVGSAGVRLVPVPGVALRGDDTMWGGNWDCGKAGRSRDARGGGGGDGCNSTRVPAILAWESRGARERCVAVAVASGTAGRVGTGTDSSSSWSPIAGFAASRSPRICSRGRGVQASGVWTGFARSGWMDLLETVSGWMRASVFSTSFGVV